MQLSCIIRGKIQLCKIGKVVSFILCRYYGEGPSNKFKNQRIKHTSTMITGITLLVFIEEKQVSELFNRVK